MEKSEIFAKIKQYRALEEEAKPLYRKPGDPYPHKHHAELEGVWTRQAEVTNEIHKNFHHLFDHWAMRSYIQMLYWSGYDVLIGTVNGKKRYLEKTGDPEDVIDIYEKLKALDDALESSQLEYIFDIKTEQDYWCCQMWLAEPDIAKEYRDEYDRVDEIESNYFRYLPRELIVLAPFLKKYERDERLIELWSGPY